MCGIAGMWLRGSAGGAEPAERLREMLGCVVHRGPDDHGTWADEARGVFLGHRRLSIIDLSPQGHQPMATPGDGCVIVFNGEVYNFRELRAELEAAGVRFRSASDTEVLLHGYRAWGEGLVDRLVGMFAFAIWDADREEMFLARDRAGEKPLYYAASPQGFAFASEISALARLPWVDLAVDPDAVALYLHYQYVPAPHSIYRGVAKLPPGCAMRVRGGDVRTWRYWDPVPHALAPRLRISEGEALEELERLMRQAVRGQMISDVPLGAFLSGGIDSTAVVALMTEVSAAPVRTFTIGFDVPRYDEAEHAERVARHLGTSHTVETLTERDALNLVPGVAGMYGEPFGDSSALPTHLVSRIARKHVTVSLSGDGGDEAFGGYTRYRRLERIRRAASLLGPAGPAARRLLGTLPGKAGRAARLLGMPAAESYRGLVNIFTGAQVRSLTGRDPALTEYERAFREAAGQPLRRRAMLADLLTYMPEDILVKVDRAGMAASLETRAPLLDHRVLEFSLRLPLAMVREKHLLKQLVYRRVPRAILDRPKMGFGVPLGRWFRGELRELLLDTLTPERLRSVGVNDPALVGSMVARHMEGQADLSPQLWALLVLGLWSEEPPHRRGGAAAGAPARLLAASAAGNGGR